MATNTNDRLLRREGVEEATTLTTSSLYRPMRKGEFPLPIKIGLRAVRWPESEIEAWLESRPRATGEAA